MNKVELLVLDVHGVVLNNPLPGFLDQLAERTGQQPDALRTRWQQDLRLDAWTGDIADHDLWARLTGDPTDHPSHDWRALLESCYAPGPAAAHVARWAARVPVWLLSNHRTPWLEPRLRRFGFTDTFSEVFVSDRIGHAKPEAAAFAPILERVDDPSSVLFLDDRMRNVHAARNLGLRAIHLAQDTDWLMQVDRLLEGDTRSTGLRPTLDLRHTR